MWAWLTSKRFPSQREARRRTTGTIASGSLPESLNLSTAGQISGTPTSTGTFDVVVQVTDAKRGRRDAVACDYDQRPAGHHDDLPPFGGTIERGLQPDAHSQLGERALIPGRLCSGILPPSIHASQLGAC